MRVNALTNNAALALKTSDRVICYGSGSASERISAFSVFGAGVKGDIFVPTLSDEDILTGACDYIVSNDVKAIVLAACDLDETGRIEARYKLSPVMLLHKLGVLDRCAIAGGVWLDNDDLDLMAQENVPLIVLPTASAGYGYGFPPVCAAIRRGVRVGIGTYDGKYNKTADINKEVEFLRLTANAEMRTENALSEEQISSMLDFKF